MTSELPNNKTTPRQKKKGCLISGIGCPVFVIAILVVFVFAWVLVRPGVFTIQPIGAVPDGITIIYHSRSTEMPFFSSPDGLCLQIQGGVSLLCRMGALAGFAELTDRIIIRLPYIQWAYLKSTGGLEFDR
jgi:hypothetical protein